MVYEKIFFYEDEEDVKFEMFCCDASPEYALRKRPAMLILPGGGYEFCSDREAEPVARYFLAQGYNCGVLRYSVGKKASLLMPKASRPLIEASKAVSLMRENADKWNIDPDKIAVLGFSAGGHLAGSLATLWDDDSIFEFLDIPRGSNKPNAAVLCYPVLRSDEYAHRGSIVSLLGEYVNDETLLEKYDITNQVSDKTPPTFLWNTYNDNGVPMENALFYCQQMRKKSKSRCEFHMFYDGPHGMSTCTKEVGSDNAHVRRWLELCSEWLDRVFG